MSQQDATPEISVNPLLKQADPIWMEDMTNDQYHANKEAVNASNLKLILKSPATFHVNFFGEKEKKETESMRIGTLLHTAILEGERFWKNHVVSPNFGDQRSAKNRDAKIAWLAEQAPKAIVVTEEDVPRINGVVEAVLENDTAMGLLKNGKAELTGFYNDPDVGVRCKVRPDFLSYDLNTLVDIKSTLDNSAWEFSKQIFNLGYDFQMAMYSHGIKTITGKEVDHCAWITVEKEPPYECVVFVADDSTMDRGTRLYRKSLETLAKSLETNVWPKQKSVQNVIVPRWILDEEV